VKLVTYVPLQTPDAPGRAGVVVGGTVADLAGQLPDMPSTVMGFLESGRSVTRSDGAVYPRDAVRLLAPLPRPASIRDFMAFEAHVRNSREGRGQVVPSAWYQVPVFYFSNALAVIGPDDPVSAPPGSEQLDLEFEVAAVIGRAGRDIPPEKAWEHVFGLAIMNDWSARDLQVEEMPVMLGPAKGKDFATSLGPWLVSLDELADRIQGERIQLAMTARVNGEILTTGDLGDLYHSIPRLIARASAGVTLYPGEVIGTGTVGGGCLFERQATQYLVPGDVVELEVERLGTLRNSVAPGEMWISNRSFTSRPQIGP